MQQHEKRINDLIKKDLSFVASEIDFLSEFTPTVIALSNLQNENIKEYQVLLKETATSIERYIRAMHKNTARKYYVAGYEDGRKSGDSSMGAT